MAKLAAYRRAESEPRRRVTGSGPSTGRAGESGAATISRFEVDLPVCGPDELLVRHDAVGLCFSDTKVIAAGEHHPRLAGRDMKANPVVLGHEVALTVMQVGANRRDRFQARATASSCRPTSIITAWAWPMAMPCRAAFSQYNVVGQEILDGDEGCYLLPWPEGLGYAQSALTEPWACVTRSYDVVYRASWQPRGDVLIVAGPAVTGQERLGAPYADGQRARPGGDRRRGRRAR
jgi:NADPH:quinone reductase-like Zn-dependent oxidoreductase